MNDDERKLLELYQNDLKKKRIFIIAAIGLTVTSFLFLGYSKYKKQIDPQNEVQVQEQDNTTINNTKDEKKENTTNKQENTSKENVTKKEETKSQTTNQTVETKTDVSNDNKGNESKDSSSVKTTNEKPKEVANKTEVKETKEKPKNKDFLFTDGYTMENVTQAAQEYLKSSNCSGECIPIQDAEGVYLGMKVVFK